jgi:hypothetical protein
MIFGVVIPLISLALLGCYALVILTFIEMSIPRQELRELAVKLRAFAENDVISANLRYGDKR